LTPGDFCFVPRDDKRFAVFAFLCPQGTSRSYFFGTLANVTFDAPDVDLIPARISVGDHALIHIKCFRENATPIIGNLKDRLEPKLFAEVNRAVNDMSVGSTHKVWGNRTIVKRANMVDA
jgi:hypothetical protein